MNEAAFPLAGALFVILIVLPGSALLAKGVLWAVRRLGPPDGMHALGLRYAVLVGAPWLPLAWLLSAGVHQSETGEMTMACLLEHGRAQECTEAALFTLLLAGLIALLAYRRAPRMAMRTDEALAQRVARIVLGNPELSELRGRVRCVERSELGSVVTLGRLRPHILVDAAFADRLDDDALAATLAHELEHVRGYDPLRYDILQLSLRVCPLGRIILGREAAQWVFAREAHCDREAVRRHGAEAAALAEALVSAARPTPRALAPALGSSDVAGIRLRVNLLLSYVNAPRSCACAAPAMGLRIVLLALLATGVLPHVTGTDALDLIHSRAEQIVHQVSR